MTTESRTHECEPWEMLEPDEDGPLYCAACGKNAPPKTIEDEDTMTESATENNLPAIDPDKDALDLNIDATLPNGVIIPVELSIVYPAGFGFNAVKAVEMLFRENINSIFQELLNRQDASLIAVMLANGAEFEEDEN